MMRRPARWFSLAALLAGPALAQPDRAAPDAKITAEAARAETAQRIAEAVTQGAQLILAMQEGQDQAEWPYEGVYRVEGQIPIGYRVGGTAIGATALLRAPGDDPARREAIARALRFICAQIDHPLMSFEDYDAGYDVRGWGYTYGLAFLLELKARDALPADQADAAERAIAFYLTGLARTEIPEVGGWNYARPPGRDRVAPPSPFMTAPTLLALFEAARQGYTVDAAMIDRALATLEAGKAPSGTVVYSGAAAGRAGESRNNGVPGATGRMLATETALTLAGRGRPADLRAAIDAFIVHWEWLEKRRAQPGTHQPPYSVAPYYFYYAHYHAALAVELLPAPERDEYRRRVADLVFRTRADDGSWNDRVFPRSANFGTAMSMMALLMPDTPAPARWERPAP